MMRAKRRILIVDDHAAVRRGLHDLIESSGRYEIVGHTWNGRAALEMAEESLPDIVTLEYSLPCLGGLEVARRLQRSMPTVEILVYTRHDREDCMLQMPRVGIRGYVAKTDPGEKILEALEALSNHQPYVAEKRPEPFLKHMRPARPVQPNTQGAHSPASKVKPAESRRLTRAQRSKRGGRSTSIFNLRTNAEIGAFLGHRALVALRMRSPDQHCPS